MKKIILYSTLGCHLCEHARAIIEPLLTSAGCELEEVDIADSEVLLERYRVRIPVVFDPQSGRELFWPFDEGQARQFLS